jgi:hypothetical protein
MKWRGYDWNKNKIKEIDHECYYKIFKYIWICKWAHKCEIINKFIIIYTIYWKMSMF